MARLFGTDGIPAWPMQSPDHRVAFRLGRQLVATLLEHHGLSKARSWSAATRDCRAMLEGALVSGALRRGRRLHGGRAPHPRHRLSHPCLDAQGGVVLSASHNPFEDNGIKIFSRGLQVPRQLGKARSRPPERPRRCPQADGQARGRLVHYEPAEGGLHRPCAADVPFDLAGLTVTLDCAHGATYRVAPSSSGP